MPNVAKLAAAFGSFGIGGVGLVIEKLWPDFLPQAAKYIFAGSVILLLISLVLWAWILLSWITSKKRSPPFGAEATLNLPPKKRSLDATRRERFVKSLKSNLPDGGTARIHYIAQQFEPLGETLVALFDAAGWQADLRMRQTSKVPLVKVQGVGVAAFNKHYMETVAEILKEAGITDIYQDHRILEVPRENPKYPSAQKTVYVYIGYEEE